MLAIIISLFLKSTQRAGSCFPWVQRGCGAQQASFCLAVNFAGPLSTSREAVGAVGLVAVWCREVERWRGGENVAYVSGSGFCLLLSRRTYDASCLQTQIRNSSPHGRSVRANRPDVALSTAETSFPGTLSSQLSACLEPS